MKKKPARQGPPTLPSRAEPQTPLFPTDDPSPKESLRQPLAKEEKQQLREQARKLHEKNWLAPAGSVQEKQFLRRWAKHGGLSQKDLDLIHRWIHNPETPSRPLRKTQSKSEVQALSSFCAHRPSSKGRPAPWQAREEARQGFGLRPPCCLRLF